MIWWPLRVAFSIGFLGVHCPPFFDVIITTRASPAGTLGLVGGTLDGGPQPRSVHARYTRLAPSTVIVGYEFVRNVVVESPWSNGGMPSATMIGSENSIGS